MGAAPIHQACTQDTDPGVGLCGVSAHHTYRTANRDENGENKTKQQKKKVQQKLKNDQMTNNLKNKRTNVM